MPHAALEVPVREGKGVPQVAAVRPVEGLLPEEVIHMGMAIVRVESAAFQQARWF